MDGYSRGRVGSFHPGWRFSIVAEFVQPLPDFQQVPPSGTFCVILNRWWTMQFPTLRLYLPVLIVYAGLVTLWSDWPEKHGGWLLAMKQKLPPALQPLHPKYVLVWLALMCVLGLGLELFLELK
jgi:hypothetical protein